jgi:hypothetical protein
MQSERGARPVATLAKMSKAKALRGSRIFALSVWTATPRKRRVDGVSSVCGFGHTALRAPPWAFTQHIVSTNVLPSPRGIGILAQSPTARPEGKEGDARVGPPHTH